MSKQYVHSMALKELDKNPFRNPDTCPYASSWTLAHALPMLNMHEQELLRANNSKTMEPMAE